MGFCVIVCLLFVTYFYVVIDAAKLPSSFGRCSIKDRQFAECFRKNVEDSIHQLKGGAQEIGLSSLDPLDIPELIIGEGTGPVNVVQHFKNVKLFGLTGSKVLEGHIDWDNHQMIAKSITPELRLQGEYSLKGKVMLLPIYGEGDCNVTLINTKINHTVYAEPFEKKGQTYWNFNKYSVTLRPEKVIYKFDNLFNGDKRLGDQITAVLNDNWNEVFTDVRDKYETSFGLIFQGLSNRVFNRVSLKDIFLDYQ